MPENSNIPNPFAFKKNEKLCSKKLIDEVFENGKSISKGCLRIIYLCKNKLPETTNQVLISVAKKRFKKAADRNRIKRLIREAYRLNKTELQELSRQQQQQINLAIIYQSNEILNYQAVEADLKSALIKLISKIKH